MLDDLDYPQVALLALVATVAVGLVWGLSTSSAAYDPYNDDWDGGSALRSTLGANDTTVEVGLSMDAYELSPPSRTVAVVLDPRDRYGPTASARLGAFVSQGGTLVVASEHNATNDLLEGVGATARVDGAPVRDERENDGGPVLPRATNVTEGPLTRGVDALTLNHGSVLDRGDATGLVNTSVLSYLDLNRNEELDGNESLAPRTVAAAESIGAGRIVVVSDASPFTNAMLERDGNRQFVRNLGADHDRALLDYSHADPLPPLSYTLLVVRSSTSLQAVIGVLAVGAVLALGRWGLPHSFTGQSGEIEDQAGPRDEATVARYVSQRHPDWDDARVRRVTEAVIRSGDIGGDDD